MDSWVKRGSGTGKPKRRRKSDKTDRGITDPKLLLPGPTKRCVAPDCGATITQKGGMIYEVSEAAGARAWFNSACHSMEG